MRAFVFVLLTIGSGVLSAQRPQPDLHVRSIHVETISTSRKGLPSIKYADIL